MVEFIDKEDRNKLRNVVDKAEKNKVITKEETGFIVALVEKFRADRDRKVKQIQTLQGEVAQLSANEKIIMDMIDNWIAAAERQKAREETAKKIREIREEDDDMKGEGSGRRVTRKKS